jgi:hypothetical protein
MTFKSEKITELIATFEKDLENAQKAFAEAEIGGEANPSVYYNELGYCEGVVETLISTIFALKKANGEFEK